MENEEIIDSKFRHAILVAKRAKQLVKGAKPKIDFKTENPLSLAIEEIKQGKVNFQLVEKEEQEVIGAEAIFGEEEEGEASAESETEETEEIPQPETTE